MTKATISSINNSIKANSAEFILRQDERYGEIIGRIVKNTQNHDGCHQVLLLAGPSSSGKTTTAKMLASGFEAQGRGAVIISLDDFYKNTSDAYFHHDGTPDFETIHALDIPFLIKTLTDLAIKGECEMPEFDFMVGKRKEKLRHMEIGESDCIIVEGIHALNPLIADHLPRQAVVKLYVSVSSSVYYDGGRERALSKRDLRFIRRTIRDYRYRNSSVQNTYELWQKVIAGEELYIFPYKDAVDYKINSIHLFEPCMFRDAAIGLLRAEELTEPFMADATRLIGVLSRFESLSESAVPADSLMREFI